MRRSYYNYSQSHTLSKQKNEGKFVFEIHDYQQARRTKKIRKKGGFIESDEVFIGNTSFSLQVHPKGGTEKGNPAIFFLNNSDHDVVADLSIVATPGGDFCSEESQIFEKRSGWWFDNFIKGDDIEGALKFEVNVIIKSVEETAEGKVASHEIGAVGITPNLSDMALNEVEVEGISFGFDVNQDLVAESNLEASRSQLVDLEEQLHELYHRDRVLVESRGKEMSELLSELEEIEEEKAAIQKQVAEAEATIRKLQDRRGKLLTGISDKDDKLKWLLDKKNGLENFIDEEVRESKNAKDQLERAIEELRTKLESRGKAEIRLEPETNNSKLKWLESIESKIETEEKELECPVCLEVASLLFFCFEFL